MSDELAEAEAVPVVVAGEPVRRRVMISVGARAVEVEGPDELDAIIFTAERMWALASAAEDPRVWSGGIGFAAEMAPQDRVEEP